MQAKRGSASKVSHTCFSRNNIKSKLIVDNVAEAGEKIIPHNKKVYASCLIYKMAP